MASSERPRWWRTRIGRLRVGAGLVAAGLAVIVVSAVLFEVLAADGNPLRDLILGLSTVAALTMVAALVAIGVEVFAPIRAHKRELNEALKTEIALGRDPRDVAREYRRALQTGEISPYPAQETDDSERAIADLVSGRGLADRQRGATSGQS